MTTTNVPPPPTTASLAMPSLIPRRWPLLAVLLVASSVTAGVGSAVLGAVFDWPAVLDMSGSVALPAFAKDQSLVSAMFYLLLVSSLLLIPAAIGVERALARPSAAVRAFTVLGITGAVLQILGWVRWPLVVPGLAQRYLDPAASQTSRTATVASYDVINAYAGSAVGEHLGWLLQAPWAVAVGYLALTSRGVPRWVGWSGLVTAVMWAPILGLQAVVPPFDQGVLASAGFVAYSVWYVWLAVLGAVLVLRPVAPGPRGENHV